MTEQTSYTAGVDYCSDCGTFYEDGKNVVCAACDPDAHRFLYGDSDDDVTDVTWGDPALMGEWTPGECSCGTTTRTGRCECSYDEFVVRHTYLYCPLCGKDASYLGTWWGTSLCCSVGVHELEFQRRIADWIRSSKSVDEGVNEAVERVCNLLGHRPRTVREYVETIRDLVLPGRWPQRVLDHYQQYLDGLDSDPWRLVA